MIKTTKLMIITLITLLAILLIGCNKTHTHIFSSEWFYNDTEHWHQCDCGVTEDIAPHEWNSGSVTKEATTQETGTMVYQCIVCPKTKVVIIPKLKGPQERLDDLFKCDPTETNFTAYSYQNSTLLHTFMTDGSAFYLLDAIESPSQDEMYGALYDVTASTYSYDVYYEIGSGIHWISDELHSSLGGYNSIFAMLNFEIVDSLPEDNSDWQLLTNTTFQYSADYYILTVELETFSLTLSYEFFLDPTNTISMGILFLNFNNIGLTEVTIPYSVMFGGLGSLFEQLYDYSNFWIDFSYFYDVSEDTYMSITGFAEQNFGYQHEMVLTNISNSGTVIEEGIEQYIVDNSSGFNPVLSSNLVSGVWSDFGAALSNDPMFIFAFLNIMYDPSLGFLLDFYQYNDSYEYVYYFSETESAYVRITFFEDYVSLYTIIIQPALTLSIIATITFDVSELLLDDFPKANYLFTTIYSSALPFNTSLNFAFAQYGNLYFSPGYCYYFVLVVDYDNLFSFSGGGAFFTIYTEDFYGNSFYENYNCVLYLEAGTYYIIIDDDSNHSLIANVTISVMPM